MTMETDTIEINKESLMMDVDAGEEGRLPGSIGPKTIARFMFLAGAGFGAHSPAVIASDSG